MGWARRPYLHILLRRGAFFERPQLVDPSLSATTNCRQDISTPNCVGNPFAVKRFGGKIPVFTFHWRDDPRKDDAWFSKQVATLDPVMNRGAAASLPGSSLNGQLQRGRIRHYAFAD